MKIFPEKKEYRDTLIGELIITANEDLDQLDRVISQLERVQMSIFDFCQSICIYESRYA